MSEAVTADIRLVGSTHLSPEEGRFVFELLHHLTGTHKVVDVARQLGQTLQGVLGVEAVASYLFDGDRALEADRLDAQSLIWLPRTFSVSSLRLHALKTGAPMSGSKLVTHNGSKILLHYVYAPFVADQACKGALMAFSLDAHLLDEDNIAFIQKIGLLGSIAVSNAQLVEKLEAQRDYDHLTGLLLRSPALQRIDEETRRQTRYKGSTSIVMLDIDHFKSVNDTYGHPIGDKILMIVADLVRAAIRDTDLAARWGGEEMLILLPETETVADVNQGALKVAERLRLRIANHNFSDLTQTNGHLTISVGVAGYDPTGGEVLDAETLIRRADDAMYSAKEGGRDQVIRWREGIPAKAR